MAYDPTTDAGYVRFLISDVDDSDPLFSDAEITALITREGSVKLAAAQALDTMASNEAMVSKVIRTQDVGTDGTKVSAELRARAKDLRDQALIEDDSASAFEVAPFQPYGPCVPELTEWPLSW